MIFPTIVTTTNEWRDKIKEADRLGIKEISLFPTCLGRDERNELYALLAKSKIERIPFVHLRDDFEPWEMELLINQWGTKIFNTHSVASHPFLFDLSAYYGMIYLENFRRFFSDEELKQFAGLCLDSSHLENDRRFQPDRFQGFQKIFSSHPVGCNHINGIRKEAYYKIGEEDRCDAHFLKDLSELDYLKNYPKRYFSDFIALEMENDFETQIRAKEYILSLGIF